MIISIVFILLVTIGIGLPLTLWIAPRHNEIGRLGLSYLLGIGFFTLAVYVANLLGLKLTTINNIFIFLFLFVPLNYTLKEKIMDFMNKSLKTTQKLKLNFTEKIIILGIGFFIVSSFINTLYWPVYIWDALTLYDFRAHVFTQTGFIKSSLSALESGYYFGYPLLTSLAHTVIYLNGGNNPQFLYSMFYLSLALVFYGQLRDFLSRNLSLLFTLVLLTIPKVYIQSTVSYTNLPYMAYFSLGAIYFYLWDKKNNFGYLILSSLLVGLSTWTRSAEPFWLIMFGMSILVTLLRKRIWDILIFSVTFFPIQQVWQNFRNSAGSGTTTINQIKSSATFLSNVFNLQRWNDVLFWFWQSVLMSWGPLFWLFIVTFIFTVLSGKIKKYLLFYLLIFATLAMFILGTFIFSFIYNGWNEIPDSAARVGMLFFPLFIYSLVSIFEKD